MEEQWARDVEICLELGDRRKEFGGAVVPPTFGNTLFVYDSTDKLSEAVLNEQGSYVYTRGTNPTVETAEIKLAALERGEKCRCFSSGMGAISAALLNSLKSGDHVLCVSNLYFSTMGLINYLSKFNISHSVCYGTDAETIEGHLLPSTSVIFMESPSYMTFRVADLEGIASLAKERGIRTIIDNTWATPLFQKPLLHGIDIVVHSLSKYMGGHSDLIGGAVIASKDIIDTLFKKEFLLVGSTFSPYEATLLIRGLRTLPFRMLEHQKNAKKAAAFLEQHPNVRQVYYPGLPSHREYERGKRYFTGYSGLMGFEVTGGYKGVKRVLDKLNYIKIGVSWGSFESLALSPNTGQNERQLANERIAPGTIRLAVGLGPIERIIEDLEQALR
ncbi:methionine gamma-lyase [Bacillus sp. FJAT-27225]|uniref:trans-sulfuration enzyme family protein n=1 Tax=Bacillus sp. FJAT-27225 TaxID=1743144 RepID=UPI00080C355E|nr:aminotransferase class I/II-fold pyridoxal phosphate-dependent enzyme [Bacillus sp. FJAT-27225]OCA87554.1 methionine gamma-lyase [Bacillus sp. FJAT-27225]